MSLKISKAFNGVTDPDAGAYIAAVEAADGQLLEFAVGKAINDFVVGCKNDGIWNSIKASCILAGARTLNGALVPLAGTAPTNVGFLSGDYNRKTGLLGDGASKYLNSNRNNNSDPQNNQHLSVFVSSQPDPTGSGNYGYIGSGFATGDSFLVRSGSSARLLYSSLRQGSYTLLTATSAVTGFAGASISSSTSFQARVGGTTYSQSSTSVTPTTSQIQVFKCGTVYSNNSIPFYSIGTSLNLSLLDSRVTTLINAIGAAIP